MRLRVSTILIKTAGMGWITEWSVGKIWAGLQRVMWCEKTGWQVPHRRKLAGGALIGKNWLGLCTALG